MLSNDQENKVEIDEFELEHERYFSMGQKGSLSSVRVDRKDGSVNFGFGGYLPESINGFGVFSAGEAIKIYLFVSTEKHGSYKVYIGETQDWTKVKEWMREVNKFYATQIHPKYQKQRNERASHADWEIFPVGNIANLKTVIS